MNRKSFKNPGVVNYLDNLLNAILNKALRLMHIDSMVIRISVLYKRFMQSVGGQGSVEDVLPVCNVSC